MSFFDYPTGAEAPEPSDLFLSDQSEADWRALARHTRTERFGAGETVIEYGSTGRGLYILSKGSLEVLLPAGRGKFRRVSVLTAGSIVGEMAFFDGLPRSATVRAVGACEVARLGMEEFATLAASHPRLAQAILFDLGRILSLRLRRLLRSPAVDGARG